MDAVIAARGAVFWLHRDTVFSHRIDTLEAAAENFAVRKRCQWSHYFRPCRCFDNAEQNRRLAVSPDGRLCAVQVRRGSRNNFVISIFGRDDKSATKIKWEKVQDVDLDRLLRPSWSVKRVCIRAVCERSGLVFFAAGADGADGYGQQPAQRQDLALYVFDLEKKDVREVRLAPNGCCFVHKSSWSFYGMVSYLSSLAERDSLM
ncbi:hypothetical protein C2845_PM13G22850 [Panicum miliaceum]|uniref:DUF295 domain-containing protein n=1 Tax=Panicum miliaceum TaxID=4540 RepID=A0A3L6RH32_PANMI|nr:hypothetical protein C2845_PM13G22850 [Panicum miliaceum]